MIGDFILSDNTVPSRTNNKLILFSVCVPFPLSRLRRCICVIKYLDSNETVTVFGVSKKQKQHTLAHARFPFESRCFLPASSHQAKYIFEVPISSRGC